MTVVTLTQDDPRYPRELLLHADPPELLHAEGDLSLLERPRIAIIGSRHPTPYGHRIAYEAARTLASQGLVIVSGLARGLDARAHRGALDAGGGTVAVLGTGIDVIYPKVNRALQQEIRDKGLLLSELPPGTGAQKFHFPRRNRIIAGLGRCLLVVEGEIEGGTSSTAKYASDHGIPVFGVPGHIDEPMAGSPNLIIKSGGGVYTGPNDILLSLGFPEIPDAPGGEKPGSLASAAAEARARLTGAEATVFDLIDHTPVHVDALGMKAELEPGLLLAALSSLELQGLITQLPGKHFALAA